MPTSIRLDRDTAVLLGRLVARTGRSRSVVIREAIHRLAGEGSRQGTADAPTFAERIAPYIGMVDSGGAQLSEQTGARVRELLWQRRQKPAPTGRRQPPPGRRRARSASRLAPTPRP